MMGYGAGLGFGIGGWLMMLGWAALVVGIVVLVAWALGRAGQASSVAQGTPLRPGGQEAMDVLRLRFARGELTEEQYLAARQTLEADR